MRYQKYWNRIWSKDPYEIELWPCWEKIVAGVLAFLIAICLSIDVYGSYNFTPATKEDYKPLQEKVSAVQENSLDFFSTPAKIVVGINEISYTVENDKCEMTGFFNHDLQLVRVTQKDKAVAKGMAIFVSLFICLSLTLILYWAILAIIFAIGLLVITIHKIFQKRKTVVC